VVSVARSSGHFGVAGRLVALVSLGLSLAISSSADANRLADIQSRGTLNCGIWPYVPGFAVTRDGREVGFDVDLCRAVAVAILGDPEKVRFLTLADVKQFAKRNDIDLVVRRLTWTPAREAENGVAFGPVTFYDGQGFLVPRQGGISRAADLAGERICVMAGERHVGVLQSYFHDRGREVQAVLIESDRQAQESMDSHRCRAYSADISWLAAARSTFPDGVTRYEILPERISKEPLAPMMRARDAELLQVVRWTIFTMIQAEELHIDSHNIRTFDLSSPRVGSFLNVHPGSHVVLGAGEWVRGIVAGVGNYGEMFDRNLGMGSAIKLDRGLNKLWTQGGLMYSPPLDR
jgi:general L-amino acid transport system substrate-binding protein